jgi:hypothetical protein
MFNFSNTYEQRTINIQVYDLTRNITQPVQSNDVSLNISPMKTNTSHSDSLTFVRATVPRYPMESGTPFVMNLVVDTRGNTLHNWAIDIEYNESMISNPGVSIGVLFSTPITTKSAGKISITSSRLSSKISDQDYNSDSVHLATITWTISNNAESGNAILSAKTRFLTNIGSNPFIEGQKISIDDYLFGNDINTSPQMGQAYLQIKPQPTLAYIHAFTLQKCSVLKPDGSQISATIGAVGVFVGNYGRENTNIERTEISCTTHNTSISIEQCIVSPISNYIQTNKNGWHIVDVKFDTYTSQVAIAVFVPISIQIVVDYPLLGLSSCNLNMFERTRIRKMVIFDNCNGVTSEPIDVSNTIYDFQISSTNTTVAQIADSYFLQPYTSGNTTITMLTTLPFKTTTVQVMAKTTYNSDIIVFNTITSIDWSHGNMNPSYVVNQPIRIENDQRIILAQFQRTGYFVSWALPNLRSTNEAIFRIQLSTTGIMSGFVPFGASSDPFTGTISYTTDLNLAGCSIQNAYVNASMLTATKATLQMDSVILSVDGDVANQYYPSKYKLIVRVKYSDGNEYDRTLDVRTVFNVVPNNTATIVITDNTISLQTKPNQQPSQILISATFMNIHTNSIQVNIIKAKSLSHVLNSVERRNYGLKKNVLYRIHCTASIYQSVFISSVITFSNGNQITVVPDSNSLVNDHTNNDNVIRRVEKNTYVGVADGEAMVFSSFDHLTTNTTLKVNGMSMVYIEQLIITTIMPFFTDFRMTERKLGIQMYLSDGERFEDIMYSFTGYTITDVMSFLIKIESSNNESLEISSSGTLKLVNNSAQAVSIRVLSTQCEQRQLLFDEMSTIPNIKASVQGDVDIGNINGLPITPLVPNIPQRVPIRILSTINALRGFDILLLYDHTILHVSSCTLEVTWTGGM